MNVKIISGGLPYNTKILVDDKELTGVQSVNYYIGVAGRSVLTLELVGSQIELEGEFDNKLDLPETSDRQDDK